MADLYVDGEWRDPVAGGLREVRCPADSARVATVSEATRADTEAAVFAARRAFDERPWAGTPERERGALLLRTVGIIERDTRTFARAESLDPGKRLVESEYDVADVVSCLRSYGGIGGVDLRAAPGQGRGVCRGGSGRGRGAALRRRAPRRARPGGWSLLPADRAGRVPTGHAGGA